MYANVKRKCCRGFTAKKVCYNSTYTLCKTCSAESRVTKQRYAAWQPVAAGCRGSVLRSSVCPGDEGCTLPVSHKRVRTEGAVVDGWAMAAKGHSVAAAATEGLSDGTVYEAALKAVPLIVADRGLFRYMG